MTKWQLNHLTDLCELAAHTAYVVVTHTVILFFFFSCDGIAFSEDIGFISDSAVVAWFDSSHFELDWSELASHSEGIAFGYRSESISKVRHNVSLGEVTSQTFNRVSKR